MHTGYSWFVANPEYRVHLRRINEARSAAVYGALRGVGEAVGDLVRGLAARIAGWRKARQTRRELEGLSDRMLADLGLTPGEIGTVADAVRKAPGEDPLVTLGWRARGEAAPTRALPIPRQVHGKPRLRVLGGMSGRGRDAA